MGTIANAKVTHYYNCYNGDFIGCLHCSLQYINNGRPMMAAHYLYYKTENLFLKINFVTKS